MDASGAKSAQNVDSGRFRAMVSKMSLEDLREYAVSTAQRSVYLENSLTVLETEKRQKDAQQARRTRQFHESTNFRESQLQESLEKLQYELTAERAIRKDLEDTLAKMRNVCRTAKERLEDALTQREHLTHAIEEHKIEIESLKNQLDDMSLLNEDWTDRYHSLSMELDREKFRQTQLEECIRRNDEIRALHVIADAFRSISTRVETQNMEFDKHDCISPYGRYQIPRLVKSPFYYDDLPNTVASNDSTACSITDLDELRESRLLMLTSSDEPPLPSLSPRFTQQEEEENPSSVTPDEKESTQPHINSVAKNKSRKPTELIRPKHVKKKESKSLRALRRRLGPPPTRLKITD